MIAIAGTGVPHIFLFPDHFPDSSAVTQLIKRFLSSNLIPLSRDRLSLCFLSVQNESFPADRLRDEGIRRPAIC